MEVQVPKQNIDQNLVTPRFYTIKEAAALAKYDQGTIRNLIAQKRCPFPTVKMGGKRLVPIASFHNFLNSIEETIHAEVISGTVVETESTEAYKAKRERGRPRKFAKPSNSNFDTFGN